MMFSLLQQTGFWLALHSYLAVLVVGATSGRAAEKAVAATAAMVKRLVNCILKEELEED